MSEAQWTSASFVTFAPPMPTSLFTTLAIVLLSIGFVLASLLLTYEVTATKFNRKLSTELIYVIPASVFLGFGTIFLFLSNGIYV
ncbi:hypothetical protein HK096_007885 [Nowakowskiella sp. JEL0078]|nr:hypothetical protein HK096_007885 [Nowakowskiella sp. JEL0078]